MQFMMAHWWLILKTLVRSSVDNYVLPGTVTGTDILLIYLTEWKRHSILLASATVYLIGSQFDLPRLQSVITDNTEEPRDAETTR